MNRIMLFPMLIGIALLHGCASMNEQECLVTDWRSVGFEDGVAGRTQGSIANYRQACSRHGVTPDLTQYRQGHAEGVEIYCRAGQGFEIGHRGSRYQGVCPANLEPDFLTAYNKGRQLFELESALRSVDNQIASNHRRADYLKKQIASVGLSIISDDTTSEERAELLLESAAMANELVELGDNTEALENERVLREEDLLDYRETLALDF